MSASEKLKALDAVASKAPWYFSNNDPDSKYRDEELIIVLRNALPQIVAVVEAAENFNHMEATLATAGIYGEPERLRAALAALDEALSGERSA